VAKIELDEAGSLLRYGMNVNAAGQRSRQAGNAVLPVCQRVIIGLRLLTRRAIGLPPRCAQHWWNIAAAPPQ
jgi:hypothetical protein